MRTNVGSKMDSLNKTDDSASNAPVSLVSGSICPPIIVDPQMESLTEYADPTKPSEDTKVSTFKLVTTQSTCDIADGKLKVRMDLSFAGELGPKAKRRSGDQPFFAYPYYVKITDGSGQKLAEESFAASVTYEKNQNRIEIVEIIRQNLPLKADGSAPVYEIHVGFQLTEDQLVQNTKARYQVVE